MSDATTLDGNTVYKPNLKIPITNVTIVGLVLGFIVFIYFGLSLILLNFLGFYLTLGFLFLLTKLMVQYIVEDSCLIKRNSITKKNSEIKFEDISHFDIENGVIIKFKNGSIFTMDNAKAVNHLSENLKAFGVEKRVVNTHSRPHMQTHK